jgi:hypothetical protein
LINTDALAIDIQPDKLVTVKVYVLAGSPLKMPVVPVPLIVVDPTDSVTVHVPVGGNPLKATLPVAVKHVGWVIAPTTGAFGVVGWVLITAFTDATEAQPTELVTVKVYVLADSPLKMPVVPVPLIVVDPTDSVTVHVPVAGNPLKATLPVAVEQVGWVIAPITGAIGVDGWVLIIALTEANEIQPTELVTVKLYVLADNPLKIPVVPVPLIVVDPTDSVTVHVPVAGNPLKATLPAEVEQSG